MSQPWPQQPQQGRPGFGQPGYGYPRPVGPGGPPPPFAVGRRGNPGAAVLLILLGTVVFVFLYGQLTGAVVDLEGQLRKAAAGEADELEIAQLTWLAALPGGLFGVVAGTLGRGRAGIYWLAAVCALAAMLLGETFATAVLASDASGGAEDAVELFFDHHSDMWESWTEDAHALVWVLLPQAPMVALATGYALGHRSRRSPAAGPYPR